jgi:Cu(I)/Ag(I) efflux system membrane fusion protein
MRKAVFLTGMVALLAAGSVCARTYTANVNPDSVQQLDGQAADTSLTVQGSCGMCKTRIEKTAKGIDGVSSASWDAKTKKLNLTLDDGKTSIDAVSKALVKAGHDTDKHKADAKTYDALPECCKYRKK